MSERVVGYDKADEPDQTVTILSFAGNASPEEVEHIRQSLADGEALRSLREALHASGRRRAVLNLTFRDEDDDASAVTVEVVLDAARWLYVIRHGATIAEAADDCREALRSAGRPPQPGTGEITTPPPVAAPGPPSAPVGGCPACTDRERA